MWQRVFVRAVSLYRLPEILHPRDYVAGLGTLGIFQDRLQGFQTPQSDLRGVIGHTLVNC